MLTAKKVAESTCQYLTSKMAEREEKRPKVELQILDKPQEQLHKDQEGNIHHSPPNSAHEDNIDAAQELFQEKVLGCLHRSTKPRKWAISILVWPYFEVITMVVILCNGVTLGMYDPYDDNCTSTRCQALEIAETVIYAFFAFEMFVKILAMGFCGPLGYLHCSWNRLDFFIVCASTFEYLYGDGEYLSSIRAARVLRPLRAINKVPSIRILVALLLDTLPMLGNVLAICTLIFVVFGIIGVQLWQGVLRNRCALQLPSGITSSALNLSSYYVGQFEYDLICSLPRDNGIVQCNKDFIPAYPTFGFSPKCTESYSSYHSPNSTLTNTSCINWNLYYSVCKQIGSNPHHGAISFDHTGLAIVAIFQVITLEGWSKIMYYLQDAYSQWVWIYFVALIVIGAYFMTNLCLVVIAAQFSETRQRESALIEQANRKARLLKSYSTLSGSVSSYTLRDQGCYAAILGIFEDICKRIRKRLVERFAGTRFCQVKEKRKSKRRVVKKKEKNSTTSTIHLHHHHHHHFHHHHHICSNDSSKSQNYDDSFSSPRIFQPGNSSHRSSLRTPTIVAIDNEFRDPRVGVTGVCPLPIKSAALLMPDTTLLICRQPSPRSPQPTHTVSFYSTSLNDKSSFTDDIPFGSRDATYDIPKRGLKTGNCPNVHELETGVHCGGYEEIIKSNSSDEDEEEEEEIDEVPGCCSRMRAKMREICESNAFKGIIMGAILLNTITMGIEHHGQPKELTDTLEIFNYIFTAVFTIEFLLKVIGYGFYGYIKDSFNLFDGTIVIISAVEIFGDGSSGVSVLRTFRLMRIFKLIRFMSSLQKQIMVMVKTLDSVVTFLALLIIFIFTVSILGMHLFGAKMLNKGIPVRHNFDSLLWALMTTFQVLTQEDWPSVMYDAMRYTSKWAAFYFIVVMTIGNYILFNLLVAILVEGFSNDPKLRKMLKQKSVLQKKRVSRQQGEEEYQDLTLKFESDENKNQTMYQRSECENHCHESNPLTKYTTRYQSRPSLVRSASDVGSGACQHMAAYNTKCKVKSLPDLASKCTEGLCECRQQKVVRYKTKNSASDFALEESTEHNALLQHRVANADNNVIQSKEDGDEKRNLEKSSGEEKKKPRCKIACLERRVGYSFYILSPNNWFRRFNLALCTSKWFDRIILFFIFFNCIVLAMESPDLNPLSWERRFIDYTNNIFTFVFLTEMVIKVIAYGFTIGEGTYLKSGWNVMDFLLVIISLIDFFVTKYSATKSSFLGVLKVFRALRTLRPLRVISRAPGLKLVVETLMSSLKPIGNLLVIAGVFFTIFGILGVQIFKGSFYYCYNSSHAVKTKAECLLRGGSWRNQEYNFDNLLKAMLTLFVFSTKDGWVKLMYNGIDAVGVDKEPIKNYNPWAFLYFFSFLLIAGFVVINMVVGVIIDNFHRCRDQIEASCGIQRHIQTNAEHIVDGNEDDSDDSSSFSSGEVNSDISQSLFDSYPVWRRLLYTIVTHYKFDIIIATVIGLNVFFMAIEHYKMSQTLLQFLKISNFIFTGIFVLEAIMKILAFGVRTFISERWNQLDLAIVALSIIGIILEELNESLPINPTIIRIMRVLRITRVLKILKSANGIQKLLNCLSQTLPQVGNLSMLFMLLFFIFSSLGMELFGKLDCKRGLCKGFSRHAHFRSFGYAMLTLFRISTGDSWSGIMKDTLNPDLCTQDCEMLYWISPVYFAVFVLSTQFVLVNVVVAVLMKQLEDSKDSTISGEDIGAFSNMDDSFSIEQKDSQSVNDEFEMSVNYAKKVGDICLNIGELGDQKPYTETESLYGESGLECDVIVTNETDARQRESNEMEEMQKSSLDNSTLHEDYVVVVSPAYEGGTGFIADMLNVDEEFHEVRKNSFLGLKRERDYHEVSCCRSMPELWSSERTVGQGSLVKNAEFQSCPDTVSDNEVDMVNSECKKDGLDGLLLGNKHLKSKVGFLGNGPTIAPMDLSIARDNVDISASGNSIS